MATSDLTEKIKAIILKNGDPRDSINQIRALVDKAVAAPTPPANAEVEGSSRSRRKFSRNDA